MRIGVIKEIKDHENRVALTPAGARQLSKSGHTIFVETGAGAAAGFADTDYQQAGAPIVATEQAWDNELVLKVKEPLEPEYSFFDHQFLFTYLHLAGVPVTLTKALIKGKVTAIAYESIEDETGRLPLLIPMSAMAGNMAASIGAYYLAHTAGGKGVQLGRVLDQRNGKVMVIGDGVVGQHAARTADGLGANVFLFGRGPDKYELLQKECSTALQFVESSPENIADHIVDADLVIGAVLIPGDRAPHVVTRAMVESMQAESVIVDVSIDQGGCIETIHATSHSDPVYRYNDVLHYGVTNMPGAYPRTATLALTRVTLPYIERLADGGLPVLKDDPLFGRGVNVHQGFITSKPVAHALKLEALYKPLSELIDSIGK